MSPGNAADCPDGTALVLPGLLLVGLITLAVLAVATLLLIRRADASTRVRVARHVLWLAVAVAAVPGVGLVVVVSSWVMTLQVTAALAFVAIPLVTSYLRPARTSAALVVCLAVPAIVLVLVLKLGLLAPIALPLLGVWLIALVLWRSQSWPP